MKRGFTLVEMLIAMAMSGLIFVVVSSLLVTLLTSNTKSRRQEVFEQVKNDAAAELSNAVRWAQEVEVEGERLRVDGVVYAVVGERLVKDGVPMTPSSVRVKNLTVTSLSTAAGYESVKIEADLENANFPLAGDRLAVSVSQRQTQIGGGI